MFARSCRPTQGLTRNGPDVAHLSGSARTFEHARTTATKRATLLHSLPMTQKKGRVSVLSRVVQRELSVIGSNLIDGIGYLEVSGSNHVVADDPFEF